MTGDAQAGGTSDTLDQIELNGSEVECVHRKGNLNCHPQAASNQDEPMTSAYERVLTQLKEHHQISLKFLLDMRDSEVPDADILREALAITSNYKILKDELGINKIEAGNRYKPRNAEFSLKVDPYRKKLFLIAEGLDPSETKIFKQRLIGSDACNDNDQLEIFLDRLLKKSSAKLNETRVKTILVDMKKFNLEKLLEKNVTISAGLCIIINQKMYAKRGKDGHSPRIGTDLDRDRLKETFTRIGFNVVVVNNLTFSRLKEKMNEIQVDESEKLKHTYQCLVVCVLAHGKKDQFFCIDQDDEGYPIESLVDIFSKRHLHMPKIFFIQACQGNINLTDKQPVEQVAHKTEGIATDSLIDSSVSTNAKNVRNICIYQASVPGTTALRHVRNGTFFARAVCSAIESKPMYKLETLQHDIAHIIDTALANEDESKSKAMVPMCTTTMKDKVVFQVSESKHKEAVVMRLKRRLIEMFEERIVEMMLRREAEKVAKTVP